MLNGFSLDLEDRLRRLQIINVDRRNGTSRTRCRSSSQKKHARQRGQKQMDSLETSDAVQVFCRIRPFPATSEKCLKRVDDKTVQLTPPLAAMRNGQLKEMQYKFEYVFDEDASQWDVFEDVGLPLVRDLIQGKNGLLFTYGITSSGKTFTMQGRSDQPGILPRTLDVLFNSLHAGLAPRYTFKPDRANGFDVQSDMAAVVDRQKREREMMKNGRAQGKGKEVDGASAGRSVEDAVADCVDPDCVYSVFISYLEIYNNYAYDLLQPDLEETGKPTVLQTRLLRDDNAGHIYVAGATETEVHSAEETLRLLHRGQKVRRVASTQLNADSSRSHAIFNIRLVQAPLDESGMRVVADKDIVRVSLLSLIDLAGSERTKRTKNDGDRLREAGNINSSLLTLRKCLDMLRSIQKGENTGEIVPYRESKLTHLLKSYFEGEGKVRMVVCLNPAAEEYDESAHVLRFAESAQEIQVHRSQAVRLDRLGLTPGRRAAAEDSKKRKALLEVFESTTEETTTRRVKQKSFMRDYELLLTFPSIKLTHHTDSLTLPQLARFLEERIARHKALYEKLKTQEEEFYNRLRDFLSNHRNLQIENAFQREQIEEQNRRIAELERDLTEQIRVRNILMHHSTLSEQAKIDLVGRLKDREYAIGQEQLKGKKFRSKLKGEAKDSAERREKEFARQLQETRDQWSQKHTEQDLQLRRIRDITTHGSEQGSYSTSLTPSAPVLSSATSTLTGGTSTQNHAGSAGLQRNYSRGRQVAPPGTHPLVQNSTTPFVNPRYDMHGRRSKSHDQCLEHRSKHRAPVGTRLQPVYGLFEKRKSVTKVEFSDTKKSQKYVLEHQQADAEGNLQTSLFKGNIIPTAGGGRSMIFDDVETLMQQDPNNLVVERKRKVYEEAALVTDVLTERVENGNVQRSRHQSAKKTASKTNDKRLYPQLPNRDN